MRSQFVKGRNEDIYFSGHGYSNITILERRNLEKRSELSRFHGLMKLDIQNGGNGA